jgi:hypothetical protein
MRGIVSWPSWEGNRKDERSMTSAEDWGFPSLSTQSSALDPGFYATGARKMA